MDNCQKSYGSDGSLTQHLKLKHTASYEQMGLNSQREGAVEEGGEGGEGGDEHKEIEGGI